MAQWIIEQQNNISEQELFGVPASLLNIIRRRGVSEDRLEDFLSDTPKITYDPFLLPDLRETVNELIEAAGNKTRICVYGDYDADGITSTTLLFCVLKKLGADVIYYVPSRFVDGYGLNNKAIDLINSKGAKLLITVDCGSTSPNEVKYAKSLGMKVIITDHHRLREGQNPESLFINPKRPDSKYPFRELSGCGVAFKIAQGIQRVLEKKNDYRFTKSDLNALLDLVAISTVADVVPLLDENRNLVKYGLDRINRQSREGLNCLLNRLSISDRQIDSSSVAYIIAPNLNALGRMDSAAMGVELLASVSDKKVLRQLAEATVETNWKRKETQEETAKICEAELATGCCGEYAPVIFADGAHEGVAGIVAGNLKERLQKPVCIVTPCEDGSLKGTGRSVSGINLHELFENCGDVFTRFGGHAGACGFSVKPGKLEEFRTKMQELVKEKVTENPNLAEEKLHIEKVLERDELTLSFAESIKRLEPFGEGNPIPVFCILNARVNNLFTMGSDNQHLRFTATSPSGTRVSCILFGKAQTYLPILRNGAFVDVAGELEINEFRGERKLQIRVKDIRLSK